MPGNLPASQPIHCPLYTAPEVVPCDLAELQPLLCFLDSNVPFTAGLKAFPRGSIADDGRLDLCKQALGPSGCRQVTRALEKSHTIVSLLLGTDGIGDNGAADVACLVENNPNIEVLYLGCNRIGVEGTAILADALAAETSAVTGLWLKRNPLGAGGAAYLAKMLETNTNLRTLDLVNTRLGPDGLATLASALTGPNQSLERLYLGGNFFSPDEAPLLADILRRASRLQALLLNVGFLGDMGAAQIALALPASGLKELGLASNGIGPDGAALLFEAAAAHPSLTYLDLGYSVSTRVLGASANALGDAGAAHAARFLAANPGLRHLSLRGCGITASGVTLLAEALQTNTHLHSLMLDGRPNEILRQRLEQNRALSADLPLFPGRDVALIQSVYRST